MKPHLSILRDFAENLSRKMGSLGVCEFRAKDPSKFYKFLSRLTAAEGELKTSASLP